MRDKKTLISVIKTSPSNQKLGSLGEAMLAAAEKASK